MLDAQHVHEPVQGWVQSVGIHLNRCASGDGDHGAAA